jgi:hypothetical protein
MHCFRQMKSLQKFASVHAGCITTFNSNATSLTAKHSSSAAPRSGPSGRTLLPEGQSRSARVFSCVIESVGIPKGLIF